MARHLIRLLMVCGAVPGCWAADDLPDPTRPPTALLKLSPAKAEGGGMSALQSVILRQGGRPAAIIGGERVELGGEYGGARLVKVSETEVVLSGPAGRETLRLTPAVEKKLVFDEGRRVPGMAGGAARKKQ